MCQLLPRIASVALLLGLACQPRPSKAVLYGPWEEGLTLAYEDPTLPSSQQLSHRLQVRVAKSRMAPQDPGLVQLDFANLSGQLSMWVRHQNGGIALVAEDGKPLGQLLPEGFPTTASWTDRGASYHIIGRASWSGAALLPPGADPVGFWVETVPSNGPRRHTLYLPNLGEVETQEWREGQWVTINRLVARGFTDFPSPKPSR